MAFVEKKSKQPHVLSVLEAAQTDLHNAEWSGVIGFFCNPIRDILVSPLLNVAHVVVPAIASTIPLTDELSSLTLASSFGLVKQVYTILPHDAPLDEEASLFIQKTQKQRSLTMASPKTSVSPLDVVLHVPKTLVGVVGNATAQIANSTLDLVTRKPDDWNNTIDFFLGLEKQTFTSPRIALNLQVTSHIQLEASPNMPKLKKAPLNPIQEKVLIQYASRYIQYAVAAYHVQNNNNNKGTVNNVNPENTGHESSCMDETRLARAARYLNIDVKDICMVSPSRPDAAGSIVAVDHQTKSVVLAISATSVDATWNSETGPFCGGIAHKHLSILAKHCWETKETRNAVVRALYGHDGYQFIVTGHGMGAAIANLIHILCHYHGLDHFMARKSFCYAFASPPVFAASTTKQQLLDVVDMTSFNFVHGQDLYPYLGTDATSRLIQTLDLVDNYTERLGALDQMALRRGLKDPPKEIVQVVEKGSTLLNARRGRLTVPGIVVWFQEHVDYLDASKQCNMPIILHPDSWTHHLPKEYAKALNNLQSPQ